MSDNPEKAESHVRAFSHDISVRGVVVIILVVTVCGISAAGKSVEEPLYTLVSGAVGWYFGQKGKQ